MFETFNSYSTEAFGPVLGDPRKESGVESSTHFFSSLSPSQLEQMACELQLLSLGHVIPLNLRVDLSQLEHELSQFSADWVPYLQRDDRPNNRQGLSLFGLPGEGLREGLSLPEACRRHGRRLSELEFNTPTQAFQQCKSLHPLFEVFSPVGRSFFVKSHIGGWFYPHRDHPQLFRESMRIIVFCKNSKAGQYDWYLDDRRIEIEEGRAYYINTRLVHKTISYVEDSLHLILNIPVTWKNTQAIVDNLQFKH